MSTVHIFSEIGFVHETGHVTSANFLVLSFIIARKSSCGKVMFSQVSVSHSVHRSVGVGVSTQPGGLSTHPPDMAPATYG